MISQMNGLTNHHEEGMYEETFKKGTQEDVDSSMEENVSLEPIPEEYENNEKQMKLHPIYKKNY